MIPQLPWSPQYERGLNYLRAGDVDRALQAFEKLRGLSGGRYKPLSSRAEVLARLQRLLPRRSGRTGCPRRLFSLLAQLPPSQQTKILRPRPAISGPATSLTALELAEMSFVSYKTDGRTLIDYLPDELLAMIAHVLVVEMEDDDFAFTLCAVSQRWRAVFSEDSRLWRTVSLGGPTQDNAVAKLEVYLTKDLPLRRLGVHYHHHQPTQKLLATLAGHTASLHTLVLHSPTIPPDDAWALLRACPQVEVFFLSLPDEHSLPASVAWPSADLQFPLVKHLELRHATPPLVEAVERNEMYGEGSALQLQSLFEFFPNLEQFAVSHPLAAFSRNDWAYTNPCDEMIPCPFLRTLKIGPVTGRYAAYEDGVVLAMPQLRILDLTGATNDAYNDYLFPPASPALEQSNVRHLTHLLLKDSDFDEEVFVKHHLHELTALVYLDVRGDAMPLRLMVALKQPDLCPQLAELHVTDESEWGGEVFGVHNILSRAAVDARPAGRLRISRWSVDESRWWVTS